MVNILPDAAVKNNQRGMAKIMADIPSDHTTPEDAAFLGDAPSLYKGPITVGRDGMLVRHA